MKVSFGPALMVGLGVVGNFSFIFNFSTLFSFCLSLPISFFFVVLQWKIDTIVVMMMMMMMMMMCIVLLDVYVL